VQYDILFTVGSSFILLFVIEVLNFVENVYVNPEKGRSLENNEHEV
jgi:hypothetical protein